MSAVHDLQRILGTVHHFRVPALVLVNKAGVNPAQTALIEAYCRAEGIDLVGKLPYDPVVTEAMVQGEPVTAYQPDGPLASALGDVWRQVKEQSPFRSSARP